MAGKQRLKEQHLTRRGGVSIRTLSAILFIIVICAILFSFFESQRTMYHAQSLHGLEQERQRCDMAIQQFMDGSDYLTDQVQQFVIKGERVYMDNYWKEVYETKSRDTALQTILGENITTEEREAAQKGKSESDMLIKGEVWAMRMVSESVGIAEEDMPKEVAQCVLGAEDLALDAAEKKAAAVEYIFGPDYSMTKSVIRSNVNLFRNEIANRYAAEAIDALDRTKGASVYISAALIAFLVMFVAVIVCFAKQVVSPLVGLAAQLTSSKEGDSIKLKESGALEIRQFSRAFNTLSAHVDSNTKRLERLSYVDFLTDVPNRASITQYVTGLIKKNEHPLGLMMIDIDNFKKVNDTYGHAVGDRVIRHVAQAAAGVQASLPGITGRLCGEEFIVSLPGADEDMLCDTAKGILQSVRGISGVNVDMPEVTDMHITVSIGGTLWRGELPADFDTLLSRADKALYASKCSGKDKYTFYREDAQTDGC